MLHKSGSDFGQTCSTKSDTTLGWYVYDYVSRHLPELPNFDEGDRLCRVPQSRKKFDLRIRSPRLVLLINEKRTVFRRHMLQRVFWQGQDLFVGTQVS